MALSAERNTLQMLADPIVPATLNFPVAASVKIYNGAAIVLDSSGNAKPAVADVGLKCVGRALATADNSSGIAGAITVDVKQGVFWFLNSTSGDAIAAANVGQYCYLVDDQTVALTSSNDTRSVAGIVYAVDSTKGVAVHMQLSSIENTNPLVAAEDVSSSGALSVAIRTTVLAVSGTKAYTLADGLYAGQRKTIYCKSAASTPVGVVTPAHMGDSLSTITFAHVSDAVELEWSGTAWRVVFLGGSAALA